LGCRCTTVIQPLLGALLLLPLWLLLLALYRILQI
jgi:hypothetical protein